MNQNPFYEIVENNDYPYARFLRTGFWKKLRDTYNVFAGNFGKRLEINHYGLFDYMAFGVPALVSDALEWSLDNFTRNPAATLLVLPIAALWLALFVLRNAVSTALTVVSSPFVFIANIVSSIMAAPIVKRAKQLKLRTTSLERYLDGNGLSLDDLSADYRYPGEKSEPKPDQDKISLDYAKNSAKQALQQGQKLINRMRGAEENKDVQDEKPPVRSTQANINKRKILFIGKRPDLYAREDEESKYMSYREKLAYSSTLGTSSEPDAVKALFELNVGELSSRYKLRT